MRLVSVVVPDWLIATANVSDMSARRRNPDSSVAGSASTRTSVSARSSRRCSARLWPATAAVPCPITSTRVTSPAASRRRTSAGSESSGSSTSNRPSDSMSLPRNVLRNEPGASVISLSRKCGKVPRSMSRVVIWAWVRSAAVTGSSVPS